MKNNNTLKIITSVLIIVALMTGTAFAVSGQPGVTDTSMPKEESTAMNMLVSGKVESVKADKEFTTITITNETGGMVFHAKPSVFVIDQKTKTNLKLTDIKEGMSITAIVDKMSPMTMSLPGQTSGAIGFVINDDKGSVKLSVFDSELLSFEKDLVLKVSKDTQIVSITGEKRIFTEEDLKNAELLVLSTIMTASLPAQTTPEFVMILNTAEQLKEKNVEKEVVPTNEPATTEEVEYVELRAGAEAKEFKVTWTSNKAPITITKNDMKAEITIGSDQFTFTHMTKDLKPLDNMKKLDGPAKLEAGKTMVPKSFIEAL